MKDLTRKNAPVYLARFRAWLQSNREVVKPGGLARRSGIDNSAMTNILAGTRIPRQQILSRLLGEAQKFNFNPNQDYGNPDPAPDART